MTVVAAPGTAGRDGPPAPLPDPGLTPWPAAEAAGYRAAGYWLDQPLGAWLWEWAQRYGDRTAVVDGPIRLSYHELAVHADELAVALRRTGLRRGDRIVVQLPNCWEFVVLVMACLRAGIAPVLALPAHRAHELDYLVRHVEAKLLVVPDRLRDFDHQALAAELVAAVPWPCAVMVAGAQVRPGHHDLRRLLAAQPGTAGRRAALDADPPHPDEVALFLLSGGTTGLPKLIPRTHNDYGYNVRQSAEVFGFDVSTVCLVALPVGHNAMLGCPGVLGTFVTGGQVVLLPSPEPYAVFAAMAEHGVTVVQAVPAVARRWIEVAEATGATTGGLRTVIIGGSVVPPDLVARLREALHCEVRQLFGMAEGLLTCTRADDPEDVARTTQGRPISAGDEILVVDEDDRPVPPGRPGELLTRGPYTPRGYYRAADYNARAFTADGWFRTGDLVVLLADGSMRVEGRRKDLINRGGEKVSAEEVEDLARELFPVAGAAALALPDPAVGERVCLVLVASPAQPPPTLAQVRAGFQARGVAAYKIPEQVEHLDRLPLTAIGKVDKKRIRCLLTGDPA